LGSFKNSLVFEIELYSSKFNDSLRPKEQFKGGLFQNSITLQTFEPNLNKNQAVLESAQIYYLNLNHFNPLQHKLLILQISWRFSSP